MAVGVAIVGSGLFAREQHLPAVQATEGLVLKAVYSHTTKSAQSLTDGQGQVDIYSDDAGAERGFEDLLARLDIQAVIIALPILLQPPFIKKALQSGKSVLSEKPIAENVREARDLIEWYETSIDRSKVTWAVAENFRYLDSFDFARSQVENLGRILTFRCRSQLQVKHGGKYYETAWRKAPSHQGGFLLDGGVHSIAGIRLLLGLDHLTRLAAFSAQLQQHLPPVDTVEASAKTTNGAVGTISLSFGTTATGSEYTIGCDRGSVSISRTTIKTTIDGKEEIKEVPDERSGVPAEIRAWTRSILTGKADNRQCPREALADLEVIESLLRSGEGNGLPIDLVHQNLQSSD